MISFQGTYDLWISLLRGGADIGCARIEEKKNGKSEKNKGRKKEISTVILMKKEEKVAGGISTQIGCSGKMNEKLFEVK